jgi:peptidoglycan/xylan/chitin deacetylase (PgdA/CDA1 family)
MDRRELLLCAAGLATVRAAASADAPEIAFTFDDPTTNGGAGLQWPELNARILDAFAQHNLKGALFVCGMRVDTEAGHRLVSSWDSAGHLIGYHSYSHLNLNEVSVAEFEADAFKGETLVAGCRHAARLFRYPYFKEGDTAQKRDAVRNFLRARGYRIGRATIDASDWAINARLAKRLAASPGARLDGYRDFLLQHIWERAQFYQSLAQRTLSRPVRHTVLLHHNALNALYLADLLALFTAQGWRLIDAEYAYQDPVYDRQPKTVPAGESLIWALAKETGRFEQELRYPGEDDTYENPRMDAAGL